MAIEPDAPQAIETAPRAGAVSIVEGTVAGCLLLGRRVIVAAATRVLIGVFTWPACT